MMDADFMQASQRGPGLNPPNGTGSPINGAAVNGQVATGRLGLLQRACEACRTEFTSAVDAARDEMWHRLPVWFGVEVSNWP
jgi:hypothetical protein